MNNTYRLVWSKTQGAQVVTSELAKTNGKWASNLLLSTALVGDLSGYGTDASQLRRLPALLALAISGFFALNSSAAWANCTPANPADGATVTCSGAANLLAPSYSSAANNLTVNVNTGASAGVLLGLLGNAMTLTGSNVTLNNGGTIDPSLLGIGSLLSTGTVIGNAAASTVTVNNSGTMKGTTGLLGVSLSNLNGVALAVQNGTGGVSNLSNSGSIGSTPLLGVSVLASDAPVVAAYGGGQVNFVNTSSGTINGRVAFEASGTPGTGNTFINAGAINGSVSMGAASTNTFTAVTGSTVSAGGSLGLNLLSVAGLNLGFAATGTIDGGAGGNNTLLLQNAATGTGSGTAGAGTITSGTYINFQHLGMNSGSWTLSGAQTFQDATLNGGLATFDNSASFGTGAISANGGAIQASAGGLNVANNIGLQGAGLTVQGANGLTLSGVISGAGGLTKNDAGILTLNGANTYSGNTNLNGGGLVLGNASAIGSGTLAVGGSATLDTSTGLTLGNTITLASGTNLSLSGSNNLGLSGAISGAGGLIKNGAATTTLTAANTYTGGTTINAGTLALGAGGSLAATGAVNVAGASAGFDISAAGNQTIGSLAGIAGSTVALGANTLTFGDATNQTFGGVIGGTGGLVKQGSGTETLTGANTFSGGATINAGTLALGAGGSLAATGGVNVAGASANFDISAAGNQTIGSLAGVAGSTVALGANTLTFGDATNQTFGGVIGGTGGLVKQGSGTETLTGANTFSGGAIINAGTLALGAGGSLTTSGAVNVAGASASANFDISAAGNQTIGSLAGVAGSTVALGGNTLTFGDATNQTFGGVIGGTGGLVKQGSGTETLTGANTFSGGATINAGTLALGAGGSLAPTVAVNVAGASASFDISAAGNQTIGSLAGVAGSTVNLGANTLTFGDATNQTFGGVIGGTGGLVKQGSGAATLTGGNTYTGGTAINSGTLILGNSAALSTGPLTVGGAATIDNNIPLALNNAVVLNGGLTVAGSHDLTLNSVVSGIGSLTKGGTANLTLSNANTYSGGTALNGGTITLGNIVALGTGSLVLNNGQLDVNGFQIALSDLNGNGNLALGNGSVTVNGGTYGGVISGAGSIVKIGSATLTLPGASTYAGGTALHQGRLNLGSSSALGTGTLAMDDDTTLGFSADGLSIANAIHLTGQSDSVIDTGAFAATLSGAISGAGFITKQGTGTLTLSGANTYTGATNVAQGTLKAGGTNTFSASSALSVAAGATLDLAGFSQSVASLANSGTVSLPGTTPGTTLTVNGAYVGNNGVLRLGTALGSSASVSDQLVLNGPSAVASGNTSVQITNLGGLGALTTGNGITLVSALNGATTTAQTTKDAFSLAGGQVNAGAYEYRLYAADANGAGQNWYLRSSTTVAVPVDPPAPPATLPTYRQEVPLYAALPEQLRQSNLAMLGNLHQRIGDDDPKSSGSSAANGERHAWGRILSTDLHIRQGGTVSPASNGRLTGFQAGTDLFASTDWRAGLYVGQLDGDMGVNGFASGVDNLAVGSNDLHNQYLGGYVTYSGTSGFYLDAVLQAGRHRYSVNPSNNASASGKGSSVLTSVEVGQSIAIAEHWKLEPQLQLVQQHLSLDDVSIIGALVQQNTDNSWLLRAGVRIKGEITTGAGTLQPYARFNVYRSSGGTDVARFIGPAATTNIRSSTGSASSELAAGLTVALNSTTSLYGEVGKLWASGGESRVSNSVQGSFGLRVLW
ncbi:outer membrane autotransporter barrel domain-containing protein [Collimonas sp. OK607]|uniref:autotransporter outer membrane beta-barrel domain-containing protein n=1 Tax=Collimonas sp. OK607 TaxID=1798194 RepID=UPI0008EEE9AE|nr:autotransporter outer membrane beta-barrel domain-containing protein [Collimonas sp. OK607]SFB18219.1 outer membrane autotransporter barrel domain-containing protein [Collimonas sp. OK607]